MSAAAATTPVLPKDPEVPGNLYCAICNQSLTASRGVAHLASQKHISRAEKAKTAEDDEAPPAKPVKSSSASAAALKPPVRTKAMAKTRKRDPDDDRSDSGSESYSDDEPAPSRKTAPRASASKDKLPRDPKKEGNFWCGICKVSLAASRVDAHLQTKTHEKNQIEVITAAMHGL